jgi:hypothetical protein
VQTIRHALTKLVHQCDKKLKSSPCPIIQILELDADSAWAANGSKKRQNPKQQTVLAASPGMQASGFLKRERYLIENDLVQKEANPQNINLIDLVRPQ